eukprot:695882-Pleurochrysis_carterae.AAC.2
MDVSSIELAVLGGCENCSDCAAWRSLVTVESATRSALYGGYVRETTLLFIRLCYCSYLVRWRLRTGYLERVTVDTGIALARLVNRNKTLTSLDLSCMRAAGPDLDLS